MHSVQQNSGKTITIQRQHSIADDQPTVISTGKVARIFFSSRFVGFILGPILGMFLYYYITYLILEGPPFTPYTTNMPPQNLQADGLPVNTMNDVTKEENYLLGNTTSQKIGAATGAVTGVALTFGSLFSRRTCCAMLLIFPTIFCGRGRVLIMTTALGYLLSGPMFSLQYNVKEVVRVVTCMYKSIKKTADHFIEQIKEVFKSFADVFKNVNALVKNYKRTLEKLANDTIEKTRKEIKEAREATQKQIDEMQERLRSLKDVLDAPGDFFEDTCDFVHTSAIAVADFFKNDVKNAFIDLGSALSFLGRKKRDVGFNETLSSLDNAIYSLRKLKRKKRASCSIPNIVPTIDINPPNLDLKGLEDFLKNFNQDIDLIDFDFDSENDTLKAKVPQSISEIRSKSQRIMESVFSALEKYSHYVRKLFYLSIIFMVWDAVGYMNQYYYDDSFDNMFVDDNLRQQWITGGKIKLLPLRKWELDQKYQYSTRLKLSKKELHAFFIKSIPVLVFSVTTLGILLLDFGLTSLLTLFRNEAKFGLSYKGMEQGLSVKSMLNNAVAGNQIASLDIKGYNLTTDTCLPNPMTTNHSETGVLLGLVMCCIFSCFFQTYITRLRVFFCHLWFPERAEQRADYLYKRIQTGRAVRRIQFNVMISRWLDNEEQKANSSLCPSFCRFNFLRRRKPKVCPGCQTELKISEGNAYNIMRGKGVVQTFICDDCRKDV